MVDRRDVTPGDRDPWHQAADDLTVALVLDALDALGLRRQAIEPSPAPRTAVGTAVGRAKTLLWADLAADDPNTYELELRAVDSLQPGDLVVCATGGSARSGIWGELLTTAALARGGTGIVTDGAVRDLARMDAMGFPVFSWAISPLDSMHRQKVVAFDVPVDIAGVPIAPGDVVVADRDGTAVVPRAVSAEVLAMALDKSKREDGFRAAVRGGMSLTAAYGKYGVL